MSVPDRTALLFYDGYELKAEPGLGGALYSHGRRLARYLYRSARRRQTHTGFYTAFLGLRRSLLANGWTVRVNDFGLAQANPEHPIGVAGYPSVLEKVRLPNPMVFGPGDYGSGDAAVALARRDEVRFLTQPCDWAAAFNRQWVGDKGAVLFAGIDTDAWPDLSDRDKAVDVLVYDKIRWRREEREHTVLGRTLAGLKAAGLSFRVLRYGHHHISAFRRGLSESRALLFLCEHETQGIAYQEAMSSGVPVLAWDEGELVDPHLARLAPAGLAVSSVPYFDDRCGMRFRIDAFEMVLEAFWSARDRFRPRAYVEDQLSLARCGAAYIRLLRQAGSASSDRPPGNDARSGL